MLEKVKPSLKHLPDVAAETSLTLSNHLDWVGMEGIEIPIQIFSQSQGVISVPAQAAAFVSLDKPEARGIHMSRLFKLVQDELPTQPLSMKLLKSLLAHFLQSHQDLSSAAKLSIQFHALVERQALKSKNVGWRTYPVSFHAEKNKGQETYELEVTVTYSSTCPASAALSRQLIQENFLNHFKQGPGSQQGELDFHQVYEWLGKSTGVNATPHAQRSFAVVRVQLDPESDVNFIELIDQIEEVLQTPVQTVVKREDEQEFALRNGQNLMFCEDAARRLLRSLKSNQKYLAFSGSVRHVESLHPHDAVSYFSSAELIP